MADQNRDFTDALASLQVRLKDALAGFDEIQKKAEPEIKDIISDYIALHSRHEAEVSRMLRDHGQTPDPDGSFFSTVQRLIIKTRSVFDEIDDDILESVVSGEGRIIGLFDDAISTGPSADEASVLTEFRAELQALVQRTRAMAG